MPPQAQQHKIAILVFGDLGSDPRVEREAAALAEAGYQVRIFALRREGLPDFETRAGFEIARCADFTTAGARHMIRKWRQLRERTRAYLQALEAWLPDAIQACDADTLAIADKAATVLSVPFVFDAHELYSDMLQASRWSGSWPVQTYWKRIERRLIPKAARVLTVSEPLAQVLEERHGVKAAVQHNVPALMPLSSSGRLRSELDLLPSEIIVLYQGVLIEGRDLDLMVEAFADETQAHLVFQGYGPLEQRLRELVEQKGLASHVHVMGRVSAADLHEYACGATIGLIGADDSSLNNRIAAPNKLFGYMMAGAPVIGPAMPFLQSVIEGERIGRCFQPGDVSSLRKALDEMITLARDAQTDLSADNPYLMMAARARHLAETRYNWEAEKHILLDLYDEVLAR